MRTLRAHYALAYLGIAVFLYSLLCGLLLQFYIIPAISPPPTSVNGLVALDSIGFHRIALDQALKIRNLGWSAWELRPQWQSPSGIASFFYAILAPHPSFLLPFNALVHSLSACAVYLICRRFYAALPSLAGSLLFALNPISLLWIAQIHRDGIFVLGNLILLYALMGFWQPLRSSDFMSFLPIFSHGTLASFGTFLVWVARPYWLSVVVLQTFLFVLAYLSSCLIRPHRLRWKEISAVALVVTLLISFQSWMIKYHVPLGLVEGSPVRSFSWTRAPSLPGILDSKLRSIAFARQAAIDQGGNSLVDKEIILDSPVFT